MPRSCLSGSLYNLLGIKTLEELHFAWNYRIAPLIKEYLYGDAERLREVLGSGFVTSAEDASEGSSGYTLERLNEEAFGQALLRLTSVEA